LNRSDPLHGSRAVCSRFSNDALGTLPVDVVTALSEVLDCLTFRSTEDITLARDDLFYYNGISEFPDLMFIEFREVIRSALRR
jgi:hypothetical protein